MTWMHLSSAIRIARCIEWTHAHIFLEDRKHKIIPPAGHGQILCAKRKINEFFPDRQRIESPSEATEIHSLICSQVIRRQWNASWVPCRKPNKQAEREWACNYFKTVEVCIYANDMIENKSLIKRMSNSWEKSTASLWWKEIRKNVVFLKVSVSRSCCSSDRKTQGWRLFSF